MRDKVTILAILTTSFVGPVLALGQPAIRREAAHSTTAVAGDALFTAYCAVCHGKDGKGGGPAARALKDPVPDLTTIAKRSKGVFSAADVEASFTGQGRPMSAAHGAQDMPIWGPILRDMTSDPAMTRLRITNLVRHIEAMQAK